MPSPPELPPHLVTAEDPASVRGLKVGDEVGAYVLKEQIGQGGMGTVYLAEHMLLQRKVAIKVLRPEFCAEVGVVQRFFNEAQAVNQIRHPNIVDIMDCVEGSDHPPYLVMELLRGQSLTRLIRDNAPMTPGAVVSIGRQICDATATVHNIGIVHRDLKPDNIFVSVEPGGIYRVKLLDFGIAKFMAGGDSFLKTMTGQLIGTPEYMAPEQIEGGDMDHRLDIYALGVILYEMLTGRLPFSSSKIGQLLYDHLNTIPAPPSSKLPPGAGPIPQGLEDAILACLAKDVDRRVQSMGQLKELLEWSLDDGTSVVVLPDLEAVAEKRKAQRRWVWPTVGGASSAIVLVALGALWWTAGSGSSAGPAHRVSAAVVTTTLNPQTPPAPARRVIRLASRPVGTSIFRLSDGAYVGKTSHTVVLTEGQTQQLLVRLAGYRDAHVKVAFDSPAILRLALTRIAVAQPTAAPPAVMAQASVSPRTTRRRSGEADTVNPFN
jgi:serine/threonine-protein kinase